MKSVLLASALTLGVMTTDALAESVTPAGDQAGPVLLTAAQLDTVAAGTHTNILNVGIGACIGQCAGPQTLVGAAGNFFWQPE